MRIRLQSVSKRYGRVRALDDVSLTIDPGHIVSVLGPNGAGKTTLLRCISAIVAPTSGHIYLDDERFTRGSMDLRRRIAFLPDFPVAFPHHTVLRHVGMVLRLYGRDDPGITPRVTALLGDFDLMPLIDTPMANLSRGQVYKAALVALLAVETDVLLLDEPFASGIDPNGISMLKREARDAARCGRTVIYSTQILDIAEKLSDWVSVIDRGTLRHYGPLRDLTAVGAVAGQGALEELFRRLREDES